MPFPEHKVCNTSDPSISLECQYADVSFFQVSSFSDVLQLNLKKNLTWFRFRGDVCLLFVFSFNFFNCKVNLVTSLSILVSCVNLYINMYTHELLTSLSSKINPDWFLGLGILQLYFPKTSPPIKHSGAWIQCDVQ